MSANGIPTAFQFVTLLTALQNAIAQGGKLDVRLAKRFVWEKLSKKVQFLQPNNDDMMKKVYTMAHQKWDELAEGQQSRIESSFVVKLYVLLDMDLLAID